MNVCSPNSLSEVPFVRFEVPEKTHSAKLVVTDLNGTLIKSVTLEGYKGTIEVAKGIMKPGMYHYSLVIDGKESITKKMVLTR